MAPKKSSLLSAAFFLSLVLTATLSAQAIDCPRPADPPIRIKHGQNSFPKSPHLCILFKAVSDSAVGSLSFLTPVARSFDGYSWRKSGGSFAEKLLRDVEFGEDGDTNTIYLPPLSGEREHYYLKSYTHPIR